MPYGLKKLELKYFQKSKHAWRQPRPQGLPRGGARAEEDPGKIR